VLGVLSCYEAQEEGTQTQQPLYAWNA